MSGNVKCGNHGGYNTETKRLECGLNDGKICAGYNNLCGSFIAVRPERKRREEDADN